MNEKGALRGAPFFLPAYVKDIDAGSASCEVQHQRKVPLCTFAA